MFGQDPYQNFNKFMTLGPENRQTFRVDTTRDHWDFLTCAQAAQVGECPDYVNGFLIEIPITGADAKDPAVCERDFVRRAYRFQRIDGRTPDKVAFLFDPEQRCLRSWAEPHRVRREDMPQILRVIGGDHRGNPRGDVIARHTSEDSFMDHLHNHLGDLNQVQNGSAGPAPGTPLPTQQDGE